MSKSGNKPFFAHPFSQILTILNHFAPMRVSRGGPGGGEAVLGHEGNDAADPREGGPGGVHGGGRHQAPMVLPSSKGIACDGRDGGVYVVYMWCWTRINTSNQRAIR